MVSSSSRSSRTHPDSSRTHPDSSRTHPDSSRTHPGSSRPQRSGVLHTLARTVAALRRGRALHTRGRSFAATFRVLNHPDIYLGIPVLDEPGEHEVQVRLSKGASLPGRLPDALGLAIRLPCDSAPHGSLDLLLTTTAWPKSVPFPSTGFTSGVFSSLVSYRHAAGRLRFLAVATDRGRATSPDPGELVPVVEAAPLRFALGIEGFHNRPLALLSVHTPLPEAEETAFDPVVNSHPALQLHGLLRWARATAYAGSRRGRGHPEPGRP
ncbi:hypothetical protein GCM10010156_48450 [Planobispora rosea]|uniref:Phosphodiesterase n=1 Tax=Planobispora rosea TaxID=35762 RepID=A0A8J3S3Q9_PLARO|nr:hypothetical protein [Planobispora rosea]GGS84088.1 hypothetical protein GCM10010156_48450 [Planobispora rosea]GIH86264.1 hypothetical protein Pro02_46720 [Planobispora rosea]